MKSKVIIFYITPVEFKGYIKENSPFNMFVNLENLRGKLESFILASLSRWNIEES